MGNSAVEHSEQLRQSFSQGGSYTQYSHEELLGQDMQRQLQCVAIAVFSGDKQVGKSLLLWAVLMELP